MARKQSNPCAIYYHVETFVAIAEVEQKCNPKGARVILTCRQERATGSSVAKIDVDTAEKKPFEVTVVKVSRLGIQFSLTHAAPPQKRSSAA